MHAAVRMKIANFGNTNGPKLLTASSKSALQKLFPINFRRHSVFKKAYAGVCIQQGKANPFEASQQPRECATSQGVELEKTTGHRRAVSWISRKSS